MTTLTGDAIIVATGSVPFFPPNLKPNGKTVIAPRFFSGLKALPGSMVVIGAGATGVEAVYLFNRLGLAVTWIVDQLGVLPDYPAAAGTLIADILVKRGVKLVQGTLADHFEEEGDGVAVVLADGRRYTAGLAFVAIGRLSDLSRLNLEAAGLSVEPRTFPTTNEFCKTAVSSTPTASFCPLHDMSNNVAATNRNTKTTSCLKVYGKFTFLSSLLIGLF